MDDFDEFYANALVYAPGEVVRVQDFFREFTATFDPDYAARHWPFNRVSFRLRGLTGRLDPKGPLLIANVAFARKFLAIDDDGILREVS